MMRMMEFAVSLDGTPEQQEAFKKGDLGPVTSVVSTPAVFSIKRVGTRITVREKSGVHPQTKQIGKFLVPEEGVYIWAECDPAYSTVNRTFYVIANGVDIPEGCDYVGSFSLQSGQLVFHLYGERGTSCDGQ